MSRPLRAFSVAVTAGTLLVLPTFTASAGAHAPSASASPAVSPSATTQLGVTDSPKATTGADEPSILARADLVFLGGDPWRPSGPLVITMRNLGPAAAKGFFVLRLPSMVELTGPGDCRAAGGPGKGWICGGAEIAAGGTREYRLRVTSSVPEAVFGVDSAGSVAGRDAAGTTERPTEFRISWPDKIALRLRASAGPVVDGTTTVTARVTNASTFALGGYSLNVTTPAGVRVVEPGCSDSGRMDGVGCELLRTGPLAAGATETVRVRLAVSGGSTNVRLFLGPGNRYTNRDISVTLRLSGAAATSTATPPTGATGTPTPVGQSTGELPRTGPAGLTYALVGVALLAIGAGLLLLRRRLARG
ncbi:LPXTG cell wall anchor domain-containing protein [Micromonospora sp. NPDC049366]|uniref:LPXTG cell wall anchor domain-containing protein n=1 Tax=Micromonospora sp. NPDC049366 TaxID=3364271 RepID=UPI0037AF854A